MDKKAMLPLPWDERLKAEKLKDADSKNVHFLSDGNARRSNFYVNFFKFDYLQTVLTHLVTFLIGLILGNVI